MKKLKGFFGGGFKILLLLIVLAIIAFSSVYTLNSNEEAVITSFGRYTRTEQTPGLKLKIPFVEQKSVVDVAQVRRMEFGYRSETTSDANQAEADAEASMLTSDENIVIADWTVQYRITNSYDYLFNVQDQESTLRVISESAYRRITAVHTLDDILTNQKDIMQNEIMIHLQEICNKYGLGVTITSVQLQDAMPPDPVRAAFLDVASAMEEKTAKTNDAAKYENEKLPTARGTASKILNDAEAYKQERINNALGDVARYEAIQKEYAAQPEIMRTRLYLEMITEVFPKLGKVYIIDPDNGQTIQFLPLDGSTVMPSSTSTASTDVAQ